jgi:hypothetical protein
MIVYSQAIGSNRSVRISFAVRKLLIRPTSIINSELECLQVTGPISPLTHRVVGVDAVSMTAEADGIRYEN